MARAKKEKKEDRIVDLETILPMDKSKFVNLLVDAFENDKDIEFLQQDNCLVARIGEDDYRRYDAKSLLQLLSEFMGNSLTISTLINSGLPLIVFRYNFGKGRKALVAGVSQQNNKDGVNYIGLTFIKSEIIDRVLLNPDIDPKLVEEIE